MNDLNTYVATGRLGADADTKYASSGTAIWSARVAVGYGYGDKGGTNWITVKTFGKRAEGLTKLALAKGSRVGFSGALEVREFERKDGTKGTSVECIANDIALLDGKPKDAQPAKPKKEPRGSGFQDDSIPF